MFTKYCWNRFNITLLKEWVLQGWNTLQIFIACKKVRIKLGNLSLLLASIIGRLRLPISRKSWNSDLCLTNCTKRPLKSINLNATSKTSQNPICSTKTSATAIALLPSTTTSPTHMVLLVICNLDKQPNPKHWQTNLQSHPMPPLESTTTLLISSAESAIPPIVGLVVSEIELIRPLWTNLATTGKMWVERVWEKGHIWYQHFAK